MKRSVALLLVVLAVLLSGCSGTDGGRGSQVSTSRSETTTPATPDDPPDDSAPIVIQDVGQAWDQYVKALLGGQTPPSMPLWSSEPELTWVEGDLEYVCDRFEDMGVTPNGDEAVGKAMFHVVETHWSTGERRREDYDYEYVVKLRLEPEQGWRVVRAPDCVFVLN